MQEGTFFLALPSGSSTRRSEVLTSTLSKPWQTNQSQTGHWWQKTASHSHTPWHSLTLFGGTLERCNSATPLCLWCLVLAQTQGPTMFSCCHLAHPGQGCTLETRLSAEYKTNITAFIGEVRWIAVFFQSCKPELESWGVKHIRLYFSYFPHCRLVSRKLKLLPSYFSLWTK